MPRYATNVLFSFFLLIHFCFADDDKCRYIHYRGKSNDDSEFNCSRSSICNKQYNISYVQYPPYSTSQLLENMLMKCCGQCIHIHLGKQLMNVSEITFQSMNESDFILPFLAQSSARMLHGFYFIPLIDAPNLFLFTTKYTTLMEDLILGCLRRYTIIVLCLLVAFIAGFIIWIMETWSNESHFPRGFLPGIFEAFWYSFISMTTVGFGDRIVRSTVAKLFSIVWILLGIIMFSLLTSLFTAEILKVTENHEPTIEGLHIGCLQYRDYDAKTIVKHGGILHETSAWNFYSDILTLLQDLRKEEIDGIVFDAYTLSYMTGYIQWKKKHFDHHLVKNDSADGMYDKWEVDIDFFERFTQRSMIHAGSERFSYGVLVKNVEDFDYFRHAIHDNRYSIETSVGSAMNIQFPVKKSEDIFSPNGVYYIRTIKVISVIVGFIIAFGIFYELYSRKAICSWKLSTRNDAHLPGPL